MCFPPKAGLSLVPTRGLLWGIQEGYLASHTAGPTAEQSVPLLFFEHRCDLATPMRTEHFVLVEPT